MNARTVVVLASCVLCPALDAFGQRLEWIRELKGTSPRIATDGAETVYVASRYGDNRGLLSSYDADGEPQWELPYASPTDGPTGFAHLAVGAGGVYVGGMVELGGFPFQFDTFIRMYDASGEVQWTQQCDTGPDDWFKAIAVDGVGNVYFVSENISGRRDVFGKLSPSGALLWTRNLTTDAGYSLSVDSDGNAFVVGNRSGDLFEVLSKYDAAGQLQWTQAIVTDVGDEIYDVSADSLGNVYVAGSTDGSLGGPNLGGSDAYVAKYSVDGVLQWSRQFGTSEHEGLASVATDGLGGVYLGGATRGNFADSSAGERHGFVGKLDVDGIMQWLWEFGSREAEAVADLSYDGHGSLYATVYRTVDEMRPYVAKLTDLPPLDGDFDSDGDVDGADLLAWQRGASTTPLSADDFAVWQAAFGAATDSVEPIGVPEPAAFALLFAAAVAALPRSRKAVRSVGGLTRGTRS